MPRKKSIKRSAESFMSRASELIDYVDACKGLSAEHQSWCHEYAVIRLYREFETLMLEAITGAINNDSRTISQTVGIDFPAHLTDELCEYLIIGNGYFDFKGRDGLIKTIRKFVPSTHYLAEIVKKPKYKETLEQLSALRNYAAHDSYQSKSAVKTAIGVSRIGSCGSWVKKQARYERMVLKLSELANDIRNDASY